MKRERLVSRSFLTILALTLCVSGCAVDRQLVKTDLQKCDSIKIVRGDRPILVKDTAVSGTIAFAGLVTGGLITIAATQTARHGIMAVAGQELEGKYGLPEFTQLVQNKLFERIPKEVNDWPKMIIDNDSVNPAENIITGNTLLVSVNVLRIRADGGFQANVTGELFDEQKNTIWRNSFKYLSGDFYRNAEMEQLEANGGKLLHEEYEFAADKIVSVFIKDLRGETPPREKF